MAALTATTGHNLAVHHYLLALVEEFDRDTVAKRKQIRDVFEASSEEFYAAAIEVLRQPADSRGVQFLVVLLVTNGLLLRALCDPALSREQALAVARIALRVDSLTDVTLARSLVESVQVCQDPEQLAQAGRLLEILDEISDGTRILSSLMRLLRHPNSYLRSKAVLMIGRGHKSPQWVRQRLTDADPRIRANAVEALWGVENEGARELLQSMVRDPDNRVVGNAILGLYMLGESSAIPELARRAADPSTLFRATAAWVMGETGDPRFTEVLAGMLKDAEAAVRKRAFAAMGKLKSSAAGLTQAPAFSLAGRYLESGDGKPVRRIAVAVASQNRPAPGRILPTHFIVSEDGEPVMSYKVTERMPPELMSVAFLMPRGAAVPGLSWVDTALECLPWKRSGDSWGCLSYLPDAISGPGGSPEQNFQFFTTPETIRTNLRKRPIPAECTDIWRTLWHAVRPDGRQGRRHVILFSGMQSSGAAGPELVLSTVSSRALVQVISLGANPALERYCKRAHGLFLQCNKPDEVQAMVSYAYLNLLARYEITWQPVILKARQLRVRLCSPQVCGETVVDIPDPGTPEELGESQSRD